MLSLLTIKETDINNRMPTPPRNSEMQGNLRQESDSCSGQHRGQMASPLSNTHLRAGEGDSARGPAATSLPVPKGVQCILLNDKWVNGQAVGSGAVGKQKGEKKDVHRGGLDSLVLA